MPEPMPATEEPYYQQAMMDMPASVNENIAYSPAPGGAADFRLRNDIEEKREERKPMPRKQNYLPDSGIKSSEELQLEKEPIRVRITGRWFWRRVIVPPNAYVVHTRIHRKEPVTLGLGISFRYNPRTDAYLVIPAAMQTIGVVANCISKEKQGINILAYVQWQIDDFSIAYKKLDLSNSNDPLGIVNAQLREQAEAAIKDKIATMSVEEVLTDKAPVIEELTSRLSRVAEGKEGLGIKIITVQIREALVSSASLWNDLQSPYRNEQKKKARISQLEMDNEIHKKEAETRQLKETRAAETNLEIEKTKQEKETEATQLRLREDSKRHEDIKKNEQHKLKLEEETITAKKEMENRLKSREKEIELKRSLEELKQQEVKEQEEKRAETERELFVIEENRRLEKIRQEADLEKLEREKILHEKNLDFEKFKTNLLKDLELLQLNLNLEKEKLSKDVEFEFKRKENELNYQYEELMARAENLKQDARNKVNAEQLTLRLIKELPRIAENMPEIKEFRVLQTDKTDPLFDNMASFIQKTLSYIQALKVKDEA
ncbi:MAG: hypothetical protein H7A25_05940 [Leptospiraceae bacterium]|nr:hypothetical protein [Leptospiraceae bacterium]